MTQSESIPPKISILSSVWNEALYLRSMVDSLVSQDFDDWELLLVDDGSTDATPEIILDLCQSDVRIKAVSIGKKLGKAAAFNQAYAHSTGQVIIIMGGDDLFPEGSLRSRFEIFPQEHISSNAVAYFKLLSFSSDPKFDGMLIPRGAKGSHSGASLTLTRPLADRCFPIPESLPNEDTWLAACAEIAASHEYHSPVVAVKFRIHSGNSTPRHKPFAQMTEAIHARALTSSLLLESARFQLDDGQRLKLETREKAEELRYSGQVLKLLAFRQLPLIDRLALASMSKAPLWTMRKLLFRQLTGWRGR